MVICGGQVVDDAAFAGRQVIDPVARESVRAPQVSAQDFRHAGNAPETPVIGKKIIEGKIITEHLRLDIAPERWRQTPPTRRAIWRAWPSLNGMARTAILPPVSCAALA